MADRLGNSPKFGEFIVWPKDIDLRNNEKEKGKNKFLNATKLGKHFGDLKSQTRLAVL